MVPEGLLVEVYKNTRGKCWSVRASEGPERARVIAHCDSILLRDVKFVVRPTGRNLVRASRQKNVHAFAKGRVTSSEPGGPWARVTYDPYVNDTFVLENGEAIRTSPVVHLDSKGHVQALAQS
jgi:hypothetical protein